MKKRRWLLLSIIVITYSLLFIATKPNYPCDGDCEKIHAVDAALRTNREGYIFAAVRCTYNQVSDSLCVLVRDTTGINWQLLADTACTIASQKGLLRQKIFILKLGTSPLDTLARKQCP
jgi:hypothetical protein